MGNNSPCHNCAGDQKPGTPIKVTQDLLMYKLKPNFRPDTQIDISPENTQKYKQGHKMIADTKISIKVPEQLGVKTKFKWILQNKWTYPQSIKDLQPQFIKRRSFQQKVQWFRLKLDQRKISWRQGCQNITIDRLNILNSTFQQLSKVNITKQVKINFNDVKGQNDAGGIFREWLNLCMKQIFQTKYGLFNLCQTDDTFYKFNINELYIMQCLNNASLLGYLIAKALMQKTPINCHLNYTIWRQILQQRIVMDDIYSFDKDFYKSWKFILDNSVSQLELNFTVLLKDDITKKSKLFYLKPNGDKIKVDQSNKQQFLAQMIKIHCIKSPAKAIKQLKKRLYQIIPIRYLAVFQPYQIDCLLCGQQVIDVKDWRSNTIYEGYKQSDQVIQWFWRVMQGFQQPMLRNMLHYCTGCSRVPVTGFKYLESNRGEIKLFTIKKIPLDQFNKYPRSYTCFNRLELPEYGSFDQLMTSIYAVSSEEINDINMDG